MGLQNFNNLRELKTFNQPIILKIEKEPITLSSVLQYLGIEELPIKKIYLGIEEINQETLHLDIPFSYAPTRIRNQELYVVNFQPSIPRPSYQDNINTENGSQGYLQQTKTCSSKNFNT